MAASLPRWVRLTLGNAIVIVVYAALGSLSLMLVRDTGIASPVWPAAGVAFGIVFLRGVGYVPGVILGSFAANMLGFWRNEPPSGEQILIALGIGGSAALGALVGALLVRWAVGRRPALVATREILLFLALAGPVACVVTASLGTAIQLAAGVLLPTQIGLAWLTWWVGDTIGVIVFAPIVFMLVPGQGEVWRSRRFKVAAPSLIVLTVAVVAIMQNASLIMSQQELILEQNAYDAAAAFDSELGAHGDLLQAIVGLQMSSQKVTQDEFRSFTTAPLERHTDLQAVSWDPIIDGAERSTFVAEQRTQPGMGDYEITEKDSSGKLVPAVKRPEYVAVQYIEPMAKNAAALGFDVYSNPVRAEAIDRALQTGKPAATAPIDLVQEVGTQKGVLLFDPAVDESGAVKAFAVGVYRLDDLLDASIGDLKWKEWNFRLVDSTTAAEPVVLAERVVDGDGDGPGGESTAVISESIDIGGRMWTLQAWPSRQLLAEQDPATPVLLLLGTLVITFLLEAFLLVVTGTERHWRTEAVSSHYDASHDELTGLLNRRGFFERLEAMFERASVGNSENVLLYLDLDGFKKVNDAAGHDAGDLILCAVADAMQGAVRERDTVARLGGDEFAIIIYNCTEERGLVIAESVRRAIGEVTVTWEDQVHSVGVSIGVAAVHGGDHVSPDELVRHADEACYAAKHSGRNAVRSSRLTRATDRE